MFVCTCRSRLIWPTDVFLCGVSCYGSSAFHYILLTSDHSVYVIIAVVPTGCASVTELAQHAGVTNANE